MKAHIQDTYVYDCSMMVQKNRFPNLPVVIGIDEVGRGSLFGQMTVGAVILDDCLTGEFGRIDLSESSLLSINDSKKLSEKKRNLLFEPIKHVCQSYALVDVPAFVIDAINIYQATLLGMRLAIEQLIFVNKIRADEVSVMIDGNGLPMLSDKFKDFQKCIHTLIKGDGIHTSIACASILAKVHRDKCMQHFAKVYPSYQFDKHKGYGSVIHREAIAKYGVLPEHRRSFNPIRTMLV